MCGEVSKIYNRLLFGDGRVHSLSRCLHRLCCTEARQKHDQDSSLVRRRASRLQDCVSVDKEQATDRLLRSGLLNSVK
ncbi:hypothetical protein RRG08_013901 [Elysia crispata]|uniref:Uncharacterized protein n=1 Tax=Elysia crispata TaxID=231223 RepID=A0AAE1CLI4_9GAST|nr:hypothetical protein RRG08_013901 [Elysia crispata]